MEQDNYEMGSGSPGNEAKTPEGLQRICTVMKRAITGQPGVGDFDWEF